VKKSEAQKAIDAAMDREWGNTTKDTLGAYADTWTRRHPRSRRTNITNDSRIRTTRELEIEGTPLEEWRYADLRRRHWVDFAAALVVEQGRSAGGAQNILRTYSAMTENAITDEVIEFNTLAGIVVRANDPRLQKQPRPARVFSWEEMWTFTAAMPGQWSKAGRVLSDCGLRVSEMLALHQADLDFDRAMLRPRNTLDLDGTILRGTKTTHDDHEEWERGRDVPASESLLQLLWDMPWRTDTKLVFPNGRGNAKLLSNFYRDVWKPTQKRTGMDIRPQEMRRSWITHLAADGVDVADLARMAGHSIETMNGYYRQAKNESYDRVREVIG
jgi:integrase